ncbi:NifB/NifX family molybdenum-iron cluster-binding protein [Puniceicoccus vermicola]|uniref:NifB/NifX family molybdenum-iron cluster-binding protein n=1 Tax=Puniceicoccus vermicola TaxID=388746 RepID=A0A7X1AWA5_9BACT|nr:NifB/NifX family molybdenum-iron cluster-binding protein [Puniceicoccus vermicola]MBC2600253.1 NifB/NifX family molybdenum-iron cluster-binding protein [Puniceicoccus vermicola]
MNTEFQEEGKEHCGSLVRVGFPLENGGDGSRISSDFGTAAIILLVDCESGEEAMIGNESPHCGEGHCGPTDVFVSFGLDAVVCRGLGRAALQRLENSEIQVFYTEEESVEKALKKFRHGNLAPFDKEFIVESCGCGDSP